jgi:hypothetical protein
MVWRGQTKTFVAERARHRRPPVITTKKPENPQGETVGCHQWARRRRKTIDRCVRADLLQIDGDPVPSLPIAVRPTCSRL